MPMQVTATVIDGALKLDQPIELPNETRIRIVIEPLSASDWDTKMNAFVKFCQEHPIHSGGVRFTREELYERR